MVYIVPLFLLFSQQPVEVGEAEKGDPEASWQSRDSNLDVPGLTATPPWLTYVKC